MITEAAKAARKALSPVPALDSALPGAPWVDMVAAGDKPQGQADLALTWLTGFAMLSLDGEEECRLCPNFVGCRESAEPGAFPEVRNGSGDEYRAVNSFSPWSR